MSENRSKANTSTSQSTSSVDGRQVVDGGSLGLSIPGSGNNIQVLDSGITKSAIELAGGVADGGLQALDKVLAFASHISDGGADALERQAIGLQEAYKDSKGSGFEKNTLVIGALAVVAVAVFAKG